LDFTILFGSAGTSEAPTLTHSNPCFSRQIADDRSAAHVQRMAKLKETFHNPTGAPLFVNLELSTSRFRLAPGAQLILYYDPTDRAADEHGSALRIEVAQDGNGLELVIWTAGEKLFHPNGDQAQLDFGNR
jgi:hypothetical protein